MKTCTKCNQSKSEDEFSLVWPRKNDGKRRPDCKACVRARGRKSYADNPKSHNERMAAIRDKAIQIAKAYVETYKSSHPCVDCGEPDPVVLDFDHVAGTKVCDVARMVAGGYRLWRIEAEIKKCEVRCANCHRRITRKRRLKHP